MRLKKGNKNCIFHLIHSVPEKCLNKIRKQNNVESGKY